MRCPHRAALVVLLLLLAAGVATSGATTVAAAKTKQPSYRAAYLELKASVSDFFGDQKALAQETQTAAAMCGLAKNAESDPATQQYASYFWNALDTLVNDDAKPVLEDTVDRQDDVIKENRALRKTFTAVWRHDADKRLTLRKGTGKIAGAQEPFTLGLQEIELALGRWKAHDCAGAEQHIASANAHMPRGVDPINDGMKMLKSLLSKK